MRSPQGDLHVKSRECRKAWTVPNQGRAATRGPTGRAPASQRRRGGGWGEHPWGRRLLLAPQVTLGAALGACSPPRLFAVPPGCRVEPPSGKRAPFPARLRRAASGLPVLQPLPSSGESFSFVLGAQPCCSGLRAWEVSAQEGGLGARLGGPRREHSPPRQEQVPAQGPEALTPEGSLPAPCVTLWGHSARGCPSGSLPAVGRPQRRGGRGPASSSTEGTAGAAHPGEPAPLYLRGCSIWCVVCRAPTAPALAPPQS